MYKIQPYSYFKAKHLGVKIIPSNHKGKKIDVLDWNGNYITSIGDIDYLDFPTYYETNGIEYALNKRRLYKIRHERDRHREGSSGYYADRILW